MAQAVLTVYGGLNSMMFYKNCRKIINIGRNLKIWRLEWLGHVRRMEEIINLLTARRS